ncbi:MAG: S9 family peptidase [Caldilineaceae bacterium]
MTDVNSDPTPPVAPRRPHTMRTHEDVRVDDYFWLRQRENPDVLDYLNAENEYTQAVMAHTAELQTQLYAEMRGRIQETDLSVPVKHGDYYYYARMEEGKQYAIHCRKRGSLEGAEEILLDENALAQGQEYLRVGVFEPSPDHSLLAYSVDFSGAERYTLYVKDLRTGELRADAIPNVFYSVEWANDNATIFYTTQDDAWRPYQLLRHRLGDDPANDALIFHEPSDSFWLGLYKSKSQRYLFFGAGNMTTSEVYFIPADTPDAAPTLIHPRQRGLEYAVEHHGERFLIVTNDQAVNFRVMEAPVEAPGQANWRELIAHRPNVKIDRLEPFRDHFVLHVREDGLKQLYVTELADNQTHAVDFPEATYNVWGHENPDFDSALLRFTYASLVTPDAVYDYDMHTRDRELKKQKEVLGGYDPARYATERFFATAADGERIPISLVRRKDAAADRPGPLLLNGYGSYGASSDPNFNSNHISLLDRGVTFAIAHVRGGGEMGRPWYENGKFLHKKNTFSDFVACAQHLVDYGYTTPTQLGAMGRSAGGLLMGAVANLRPELFKVIIAGVPFVDVINTMLDASIPLTAVEYEEWGNPNDPQFYVYMKSYSPYDNVAAKAYPHILATAGLNDPRVQYWEPAKWVAKLRAMKTDRNRLLLKTNMGAGHGGASGRFDYLEEVAFEYAFLLDLLEVE